MRQQRRSTTVETALDANTVGPALAITKKSSMATIAFGLSTKREVGIGWLLLATRLCDPGPFHVGFGVVVSADEEITYFCAEAKARRPSAGSKLPSGDAQRRGDPGKNSAESIGGEMLRDLRDLLA